MQRSDQPAKRGRGSPRKTPIVNSPVLKPGSERRDCSRIARQQTRNMAHEPSDRLLTVTEFQQLAAVPAGIAWFANVRQHREEANPKRLSDRHQRFHAFVGIRIPEVPERFSSFVGYHVSSGSKLQWVSPVRPFPPNTKPSSLPTTKLAPRPRGQRRSRCWCRA